MRYHLDYYVFLLMVNKFFICDLCYVEDVSACLRYGLCPLYVSFVASLVPCDMSGFMEMFVHRGVSDLFVFYLCLSRTFVSRFVDTSLDSRFVYLRRICS